MRTRIIPVHSVQRTANNTMIDKVFNLFTFCVYYSIVDNGIEMLGNRMDYGLLTSRTITHIFEWSFMQTCLKVNEIKARFFITFLFHGTALTTKVLLAYKYSNSYVRILHAFIQ